LVADYAVGIGADVGLADVVAEDDENVRLAAARGGCRRRRGLLGLRLRFRCQCCGRDQGRRSEQKVATVDALALLITHTTLSICDYRTPSREQGLLTVHRASPCLPACRQRPAQPAAVRLPSRRPSNS